MDNIDSDKFKLLKMLTLHEGLKLKVYDDANGKELKAGDTLIGHPTIGVGRNVASDGLGINEEEANFLLMGDIARIDREAKQFKSRADRLSQIMITGDWPEE